MSTEKKKKKIFTFQSLLEKIDNLGINSKL